MDYGETPYQSCVAPAAQYYQVNPELLSAIMATEGGAPGQMVKNKNGSLDMGPMQINTVHLKKLSGYGVTAQHLVYNGCLNVYIGAWMLRKKIVEAKGDVWKGVGNYHSATPVHHGRYVQKVWRNLSVIYAARKTEN